VTATNFLSTKWLPDWRGWLLPVLIILAWDWMSRLDANHAYAFASLSQIATAVNELWQSGELLANISTSVKRAMTGLLFGASAGFVVGSLVAVSRTANILITPIYHAIRQVPLLGLVPLFALWFGNGDTSKLIVVSLSAFYPVVLSTFEGMLQGDRRYQEVGQVYKLSQWKVYRKIILPAALPQIFTGFSLALAFAWLSTIGSELLFTAGAGLGNLMMNAQEASRMDILIIVTFVVGILGYLMSLLIKLAGTGLFKWRNTH
jgi:sulfonate transport system permease protein